jgi:site-specific recombinase XerD
MDGLTFFDDWKAVRLADTVRKPMGDSGLKQAALVWNKWLLYCHGKKLAWKEVVPGDVFGFVEQIAPRTNRDNRKVSVVSQKRYCRIVRDLYAHAVLSGILEENPATEAMPTESERTPSMALTPNMWLMLQECLPSGHTYKERRNRLALLLIMRCALTVTEIISLQINSAEAHDGTPEQVSERLALAGLPLLQPESPFWDPLEKHPIYALQIGGPRSKQTRRLILDRRTSKAVHDWMEVRNLSGTSSNSRLLLGDSYGVEITAKGLYNICQAHIEKGLTGVTLLHAGPNTLRNTCISIWLNQGTPVGEVMRRCGLKDAGILTRLGDHINPTVTL